MADEKDSKKGDEDKGEEKKGGGGENKPKCPECKPGAPGWLATFSDLCTLLLTFFILLLSFAKTETAKYESALGSVRDAFGGNVLQKGDVLMPGKSADDDPVILDGQSEAKPFPIEFLTSEGLLDKKEVNRESTEDLKQMQKSVSQVELDGSVDFTEIPEGIKVNIKDRVYFKEGSTQIENMSVEVFEKMIHLLKDSSWHLFVEGYAALNEVGATQEKDAFELSSERAMLIAKTLMKKGVSADKISVIFYGSSRSLEEKNPEDRQLNRRVEFKMRKVDLRYEGQKK